MTNINTKTAINIGVVITLLVAAMSYGILFQQVQEVRSQQIDLKTDIKTLAQKVDTVLIRTIAQIDNATKQPL